MHTRGDPLPNSMLGEVNADFSSCLNLSQPSTIQKKRQSSAGVVQFRQIHPAKSRIDRRANWSRAHLYLLSHQYRIRPAPSHHLQLKLPGDLCLDLDICFVISLLLRLFLCSVRCLHCMSWVNCPELHWWCCSDCCNTLALGRVKSWKDGASLRKRCWRAKC